MKTSTLIQLVSLLALASLNALAQQAPKLLPFQGRLADQNGIAVSNGVRLVQFKIFEVPSGGSPVWAGELHRTTLNGGLVNVLLGSKTPFTGVDFDRQLYLEITVDINGDNAITAADPPMLPRQAILPVVFAKESADSRLLNGHDWSSVFAEGATNPATARIAGSRIVAQSVTAAQIAPQTITAEQIAPGTITSGQLAAGIVGGTQLANSSVAVNHLTAELIADAIHPPGSIMAWMGTNSVAPAGWEFADGREFSRADPKYARLFLAVGTSSGSGDGTTTFNLPDLRGMFLRGVTGSLANQFADPDSSSRTSSSNGGNVGNAVGSVQLDGFQDHKHRPLNDFLQGDSGALASGGSFGARVFSTGLVFPESGVRVTSETRPKNVYVHYLIKL